MGGILIAFAILLWQGGGGMRCTPGSAEHLTRLTHVLKATAAVRAQVRLDQEPADGWVERLLAPSLLHRYQCDVLGRPVATRGTTHISVIDRDGMAASLSISNGEGSACVIPGTGIVLNNMLGEEDLNPSGLQHFPPDQRMSSMMCPAMAITADGSLMALGSGGSNRIRSAILQVLLNSMEFGMGPDEAVAAPRLHLEGTTLSVEPGYAEDALARLEPLVAKIDRWEAPSMFFGGVHLAHRHPRGAVSGAGDPRRGGSIEIV